MRLQNRFATLDTHSGVIRPRLDALGPQRRLDPNAPLVAAWLAGRPVVLARPDPRTRRPGVPADLTIPLSISRLRRAIDIEGDRATGPFMRSEVDDWPLAFMPMMYTALPTSSLGQPLAGPYTMLPAPVRCCY